MYARARTVRRVTGRYKAISRRARRGLPREESISERPIAQGLAHRVWGYPTLNFATVHTRDGPA